MEQKKTKSKGRGKWLIGGAGVVALAVLLSSFFGLNLGGRPSAVPTETTVAATGEQATQGEATLQISGNQLYYRDEVLAVDKIAETFQAGQRVVVKAADAKQLFYDEVIAELTAVGCVIIEE